MVALFTQTNVLSFRAHSATIVYTLSAFIWLSLNMHMYHRKMKSKHMVITKFCCIFVKDRNRGNKRLK